MTYEEAYKILTEHTRHYIPRHDEEALEIAIKAVGKQIPQEANIENLSDFIDWYSCPSCGGCFAQRRKTFCDKCGQALKWDNNEETERAVEHE